MKVTLVEVEIIPHSDGALAVPVFGDDTRRVLYRPCRACRSMFHVGMYGAQDRRRKRYLLRLRRCPVCRAKGRNMTFVLASAIGGFVALSVAFIILAIGIRFNWW